MYRRFVSGGYLLMTLVCIAAAMRFQIDNSMEQTLQFKCVILFQ